jgi:hypothetical protein
MMNIKCFELAWRWKGIWDIELRHGWDVHMWPGKHEAIGQQWAERPTYE